MNQFDRTVKKLGGVISKNSPTILTTLAVGGMLTTVVFAVRATPKANALIENDSRANHEGDPNAYTKKEAIISCWRVYIPAVCMGAATIACIVGSNSINNRRNAALASVYGLTEAAFREYKEKVVETIGKKKELSVRDEISKDHVAANPPKENTVILTGKGNTLCRDEFSGQYFRSDVERIRQAVNTINEQRIDEMWVSLNDLYYEIGADATKGGELLGWDLDTGGLKITFSTQLTKDNEPCIVLNYDVFPKYL